MIGAGLRLKDEDLIRAADRRPHRRPRSGWTPAYEPLLVSRIAIARAGAKAALGGLIGDLARVARSISALANSLDTLGRDQSPLDWARGRRRRSPGRPRPTGRGHRE